MEALLINSFAMLIWFSPITIAFVWSYFTRNNVVKYLLFWSGIIYLIAFSLAGLISITCEGSAYNGYRNCSLFSEGFITHVTGVILFFAAFGLFLYGPFLFIFCGIVEYRSRKKDRVK